MITIGKDALAPENRQELFDALRSAGILVTMQEWTDEMDLLREAAQHPETMRDPDANLKREGDLREARDLGPFLWVP